MRIRLFIIVTRSVALRRWETADGNLPDSAMANMTLCSRGGKGQVHGLEQILVG